MLSELARGKKVTGLKQTKRAVAEGRAAVVYIADDAEERLRRDLTALCSAHDVPVAAVSTMLTLGRACGIQIGASSAALLRE
ncbi:MAG: 50S ribosomal protein L7ae-like protein [Ruminococcaceae bacterium]|jgi:large subunit ribosomal protein L7A|nr:50S ribosomal protein L7ae-like protein [Oscillospiraceae bacterium]